MVLAALTTSIAIAIGLIAGIGVALAAALVLLAWPFKHLALSRAHSQAADSRPGCRA